MVDEGAIDDIHTSAILISSVVIPYFLTLIKHIWIESHTAKDAAYGVENWLLLKAYVFY